MTIFDVLQTITSNGRWERMNALVINNKQIKVNISQEHITRIELAMRFMKSNVFVIGEHLSEIKKEVEAAGQGKLLFEIAEELFGFHKSNTYNYMRLYEKFGESQDQYSKYSISQLTEMVALPEECIPEVTHKMTIKNIRELKKKIENKQLIEKDKESVIVDDEQAYIDVEYTETNEVQENLQETVFHEKFKDAAEQHGDVFKDIMTESTSEGNQVNQFQTTGIEVQEKTFEELVEENEMLRRRNKKRTQEWLEVMDEKSTLAQKNNMIRRDSDILKNKLMNIEFMNEGKVRKSNISLATYILENLTSRGLDETEEVLKLLIKGNFEGFNIWEVDQCMDGKVQKRIGELLLKSEPIDVLMNEYGLKSISKTSNKQTVKSMFENTLILENEEEELEVNIDSVSIYFKPGHKNQFVGVESIHNNGLKLSEKFVIAGLNENEEVLVDRVKYLMENKKSLIYFIRHAR